MAADPKLINIDFEALKASVLADLNDPITVMERVYQIWWHWADFHLYILTPFIPTIFPPIIIPPQPLPDSDELEFVYPIHDFGSRLSTSKSEDMFHSGSSMCKLFFTIEKMIYLLIERLHSGEGGSGEGGLDPETRVEVAFSGHEIAQRKAFESIINLNYNVLVTNFEPGEWGERYLQIVKRIAKKYGFPPESPRDIYKKPPSTLSAGIKR